MFYRYFGDQVHYYNNYTIVDTIYKGNDLPSGFFDSVFFSSRTAGFEVDSTIGRKLIYYNTYGQCKDSWFSVFLKSLLFTWLQHYS